MTVRIVIAIMQLAIAKKKKQVLQSEVKKMGPFTPSTVSNVFAKAEREDLQLMLPADRLHPELYREITRAWVEVFDQDLATNEELNKQDSTEATKKSDALLLEELRKLLYNFDTIVFGNVRKQLNSNKSGV
jgi:hypothetical protein